MHNVSRASLMKNTPFYSARLWAFKLGNVRYPEDNIVVTERLVMWYEAANSTKDA